MAKKKTASTKKTTKATKKSTSAKKTTVKKSVATNKKAAATKKKTAAASSKTKATQKKAPVKTTSKATKKKAPAKTTSKASKKTVSSKKSPGKSSQTKKTGVKKKAAQQKASEVDPAAKDMMLSARKRKSTPSIFKVRNRRNTPILFTLNDVKEIIDKRKEEESSAETQAPRKTPKPKKKTAPQKSSKQDLPPTPSKASSHGAASIADILGFNPQEKKEPQRTSIDESKIPKKYKSHFKDLMELRDHLLTELDLHTKETLHHSGREETGDLSNYSQHMADAGTDSFDRDFALSLLSTEQEALFEIEEAIKRIQNGTYGTCEITSKPIRAERLRAVPFTRYSLEGQQELERQKRRNVERGGVFADASEEDSVQFTDEDND